MAAFRVSVAVAAAAARVPSIRFPVRRLPDGTRVSDLAAGASSDAASYVSSPTMPRASPYASLRSHRQRRGFQKVCEPLP